MWSWLSNADNGVRVPVAVMLIGALGATLVVLGLFGGYLLAVGTVALIVITPFILGGLELREWLVSRQAAQPESVSPAEAPAHRPITVLESVPVPRPVMVRVTQAEGVCPLGRQYFPGQTFLFTDGVTGQGLCPRAEALLRPAIERYRQGDTTAGALTVMCRSSKHIVVLSIVEEAEVPRVAVGAA